MFWPDSSAQSHACTCGRFTPDDHVEKLSDAFHKACSSCIKRLHDFLHDFLVSTTWEDELDDVLNPKLINSLLTPANFDRARILGP